MVDGPRVNEPEPRLARGFAEQPCESPSRDPEGSRGGVDRGRLVEGAGKTLGVPPHLIRLVVDCRAPPARRLSG